MKQLLTLIIFATAFVSSSIAQEEKTIYIIDGYTLEPLVGFTAVSQSAKTTIKTDYNTIVTNQKSKGSVTVSKEGYASTTFELAGKADQDILLEPTGEQKIILRKQFIPASAVYDEGDENKPLVMVDEKAEFPGGQSALSEFLAENLVYPKREIELGIEGKNYCKFIVETDGTISDVTIIKGLTKNTDMESYRVLKLMPKWKPSKKDGIAVRSYFTLPISFQLF